jgi:hypothetical protein
VVFLGSSYLELVFWQGGGGWREKEDTLGWAGSPWQSATHNCKEKLEDDTAEEVSEAFTVAAEAGSRLRRTKAVR